MPPSLHTSVLSPDEKAMVSASICSKRIQVLDGVRSCGGHPDRRDAAVGAIRELLDADRTLVAAAARQRGIVIEKVRVALVVDDARDGW